MLDKYFRIDFTENMSAIEPLMVVAPEHFTTYQQNPEFECLEKVDSSDYHQKVDSSDYHHTNAPDVLEMKDMQPETKARARSQIPKLIRPQSNNSINPGTNLTAGPSSASSRKISESRKSIASLTRSNSTLSSKSSDLDPNSSHAARRLSRQNSSIVSRTSVSRSTSSASVASQVIKESNDEGVFHLKMSEKVGLSPMFRTCVSLSPPFS